MSLHHTTQQVGIAEFVNRIAFADLVLDTTRISAHTVAMDVAWAGVPSVSK